MSHITIEDLNELTSLDIQTMHDTCGGRRYQPGKLKEKFKNKTSRRQPAQQNTVFFGFNNTFIGNTVGVNNGSLVINGGIGL